MLRHDREEEMEFKGPLQASRIKKNNTDQDAPPIQAIFEPFCFALVTMAIAALLHLLRSYWRDFKNEDKASQPFKKTTNYTARHWQLSSPSLDKGLLVYCMMSTKLSQCTAGPRLGTCSKIFVR